MRAGIPVALAAAAFALSPATAQEAPKQEPPPPPAKPRTAREFQAAVNRAIERGVAWLRERQQRDGTFEIRPVQMFMIPGPGTLGPTALALYTLRACGVPADDAAVVKGFWALRARYEALRVRRDGLDTYGVALTLLALEAHRAAPAPPPAAAPGTSVPGVPSPSRRIPEEDLLWMRELTRWLVLAQTDGGGFSYGSPARGPVYDFSNGQFALLGLKTARRCGIDVHREVWRRAADHLLEHQEKRGPPAGRFEPAAVDEEGHGTGSLREVARDAARGWGYRQGMPATGSMTSGGVSSLVICRSELLGSTIWGQEADRRLVRGVRDGIAWLGLRFTVSENPGPPGAMAFRELWHTYYLYGLERAGVLAGVSHMERHAWYDEGARFLLDAQRDDGSWIGERALAAGASPGVGPDAPTANFLDTCFALLFLKRATFRVDRGAVATEAGEERLDLEGAAALGEADFAAVFDAVFGRFRSAEGAARDARAADFVRLGTRSLPHLLRRLEAEEEEERAAALEALRRTTGETKGFDAKASGEARAAAVASWEEWWFSVKERLVADPGAGRFR